MDNENFDMGAITTLRPFSGGATTTPVALAAGSGTFDEIRVGATFSSVTSRLVPDLNIAVSRRPSLLPPRAALRPQGSHLYNNAGSRRWRKVRSSGSQARQASCQGIPCSMASRSRALPNNRSIEIGSVTYS